MSIAIALTLILILVTLMVPTKKKPPLTRYDDRVIDFIAGKACLRDVR